MSGAGKARTKWVESGGRARAAATAAAALQGRNSTLADDNSDQQQIRRARGAWVGIFLLMVTVWSTILISAIFSLRINRESCEYCPDGCTCRGSPPAWG